MTNGAVEIEKHSEEHMHLLCRSLSVFVEWHHEKSIDSAGERVSALIANSDKCAYRSQLCHN